MPAGGPTGCVRSSSRWGFEVLLVDVGEFHKAGGSIRCLTNPLDVVRGRDLPRVAGGEVLPALSGAGLTRARTPLTVCGPAQRPPGPGPPASTVPGPPATVDPSRMPGGRAGRLRRTDGSAAPPGRPARGAASGQVRGLDQHRGPPGALGQTMPATTARPPTRATRPGSR